MKNIINSDYNEKEQSKVNGKTGGLAKRLAKENEPVLFKHSEKKNKNERTN